MVEIFNFMALNTVRQEESLFRSLMSTVSLLELRTSSLHAKLMQQKLTVAASSSGAASSSSSAAPLPSVWGETSSTPRVYEQAERLREVATRLAEHKAMKNRPGCFLVESVSGGTVSQRKVQVKGFSWKVVPEKMLSMEYEEACACGLPASSLLGCAHLRKVVKLQWRKYLKPWCTVQAWEAQVGQSTTQIDGEAVVAAAEKLLEEGKLLQLTQPKLRLGRKGRPGDQPPAGDCRRAKSFMEETVRFGDQVAAAKDTVAGASGKNQGGIGVEKGCTLCKAAGRDPSHHRRHECPFREGVTGVSQETACPGSPDIPEHDTLES